MRKPTASLSCGFEHRARQIDMQSVQYRPCCPIQALHTHLAGKAWNLEEPTRRKTYGRNPFSKNACQTHVPRKLCLQFRKLEFLLSRRSPESKVPSRFLSPNRRRDQILALVSASCKTPTSIYCPQESSSYTCKCTVRRHLNGRRRPQQCINSFMLARKLSAGWLLHWHYCSNQSRYQPS